ncbi:MAG TPA: regulatory protein RecX [Caproicibacter sp.]|nr:regulatory protein RecX [Caproicibacter sp.]
MMLTAAEPRGKGLIALFIDGEQAVSIDAETYLKSGLKPGDDLTDERLHELIEASDVRRAEQKAMYLLGYRSHSQKELAQKLSRTVSREAADRAAEKMTELGLVNDEEYARSLARSMFGRKGFAASRVRMELMRKGIDRELAEQIAQEAEPDPREAIRQMIDRKYARCLDDEKGRRRTVAALQRMGYRWDDIRSALHEFITDEEE